MYSLTYSPAVCSPQGQPSMHDNLRLQRLVGQLANKVKKLMDRQDESCTDTDPHDSHQEIMALAGATFNEMSLQVNTTVLDPMHL